MGVNHFLNMTTTKRGPKHEFLNFTDCIDPIEIVTKKMDQIYIGKCINSTFIVKKKVNQITFENCVNSKLICEDNVIGTINVLRCKKAVCRTKGELGSLELSFSDETKIYMNHETITNSKIVAAG